MIFRHFGDFSSRLPLVYYREPLVNELHLGHKCAKKCPKVRLKTGSVWISFFEFSLSDFLEQPYLQMDVSPPLLVGFR